VPVNDPECAGTQFTKTIPIRIVASAGLETIVTAFTDFNIILAPDCTQDEVRFDIPAGLGDIPYFITQPTSTPMQLNPVYYHKIPECPVQCRLTEDLVTWDVANPSSIVKSFDPITGQIVLSTNDVRKDGTESLVVVECYSTVSDSSSGIDFKILLRDECRNVDILDPSLADPTIETELFETLFTQINPAAILSDYKQCSAFSYSIISSSLKAPAYFIDNLSIRSEPTSFLSDLGEFDFYVMACLRNYAFVNINCGISPLSTYKVSNPCLKTQIQINAVIPDDELVMYQQGEDIIQYFLNNNNFPDTESLRINSLGYPMGVCGPNRYAFVYQLTNNGPVPFLDQDLLGNLFFRPTSFDDPQIYALRINVTKKNYAIPA